jgi:antitoxin MazE
MTVLRNIGNSQGVLIPKVLIHEADLEGHELEFEVHAEGLLIKPVKAARATWKAQIAAALQTHDHDIDQEWLDADLLNLGNDDE